MGLWTKAVLCLVNAQKNLNTFIQELRLIRVNAFLKKIFKFS